MNIFLLSETFFRYTIYLMHFKIHNDTDYGLNLKIVVKGAGKLLLR